MSFDPTKLVVDVLTSEMFKKCLERIASGVPSEHLLVGMNEAVNVAVGEIQRVSKIPGKKVELSKIATCASDFDIDVGAIISKAAFNSDSVTLQKSVSGEASATHKGIRFKGGYIRKEFAAQMDQCILQNPYVMVWDGRISEFDDLRPALKKAKSDRRPLLMAAREFDSTVVMRLLLDRIIESRICCPVTPGLIGKEGRHWLEDLARLTNSYLLEAPAKSVPASYLGEAERIIVDEESTTVVTKKGISGILEKWYGGIKIVDHEQVQRLSYPVTVVEIGGGKPSEKKLTLAENALSAVHLARTSGYVPNFQSVLTKAHSAVGILS